MHAIHTTRRRGSVLILSILTLLVLTAVAAGIGQLGIRQRQVNDNHLQVTDARLAAESGVEWALAHMKTFRSPGTYQTIDNILPPLAEHFARAYGYEQPGYPETQTDCPVLFDCQDVNQWHEGDTVRIAPQRYSEATEANFAVVLEVAQTKIEDGVRCPTMVAVTSTGDAQGLTREIRLLFSVQEDIKRYGVYSSCRVIARGTAEVYGPVRSNWVRRLRWNERKQEWARNHSTFPLDVKLSGDGIITGELETPLSSREFTGNDNPNDKSFINGIQHHNSDLEEEMRSRIGYNARQETWMTADAFDTGVYRDMTAPENLPEADDTGLIGVYNIRGSRWEGKEMENICVPKGTHAKFTNCTFRGVTYIEVDEDETDPTLEGQNSVVFENCTFEGPVITGKPHRMDWRYNCMQFVGDTVFKGDAIESVMEGVTLMAPNYNVNIGGSEGGGDNNSQLRGMVVGGCVDLYGTLDIHGTVISMVEVVRDDEIFVAPGGDDRWLCSSNVCGANVGNVNGSGKVVIRPNPDLKTPIGMVKTYVLDPAPGTYSE
jgi:hypothetical protein